MTQTASRDAHPKKPRSQKYFRLSETNSGGMDNYWWVEKKRKGYCLFGSEVGQVGDANPTIGYALNEREYDGGRVKIETNVHLEELLEIMNSRAF